MIKGSQAEVLEMGKGQQPEVQMTVDHVTCGARLNPEEIPISEIAFSSRSRANHSPVSGYATCR
jgi:hypothetical protein